jgi:hypothetical protein
MQLGLLEELRAAGGHFVTKHLMYADGIPIEAARSGPLDLATLVPNVSGAMTLGHPRLCDVLDQAAQTAGATLVRGIANVTIEAGLPPTVAFDHEGERHTFGPDWSLGPMDVAHRSLAKWGRWCRRNRCTICWGDF